MNVFLMDKIARKAPVAKELKWHQTCVQRKDREQQNSHKGQIIWFTGLSGAGKSTLANGVEEILFQKCCRTYLLDGDNIRHGLCSDLGFSVEDRCENIRRIGETARLFMDAGMIVLSCFISPFREDREFVRSLVPVGDYIEVYCNADLDVCEQRDIKGLYQKARKGEISEFTGISSPYEAPVNPELELNTGNDDLESCVDAVISYLELNGVLTSMPVIT